MISTEFPVSIELRGAAGWPDQPSPFESVYVTQDMMRAVTLPAVLPMHICKLLEPFVPGGDTDMSMLVYRAMTKAAYSAITGNDDPDCEWPVWLPPTTDPYLTKTFFAPDMGWVLIDTPEPDAWRFHSMADSTDVIVRAELPVETDAILDHMSALCGNKFAERYDLAVATRPREWFSRIETIECAEDVRSIFDTYVHGWIIRRR